MEFDKERTENIVGKGENAGYQHFLLFPQCFQKPSSIGLLKSGIVCKGLINTTVSNVRLSVSSKL